MARKTPEQAALTRQNIIESAARVFCQKGIAGSTLEAIAREAGVTRGAIYWHFEGKQGLLQALLNEQLLPFEREFPQTEGFAAGWNHLCRALEDTMSADISQQLSRILLHKSERVPGGSPVAERLQQIRSSINAQLQRLLSNAVASGELAGNLDIEVVCEVFQSCISGLLFESLLESGVRPGRAAAMFDTLHRLLNNPPAHWLVDGCATTSALRPLD